MSGAIRATMASTSVARYASKRRSTTDLGSAVPDCPALAPTPTLRQSSKLASARMASLSYAASFTPRWRPDKTSLQNGVPPARPGRSLHRVLGERAARVNHRVRAFRGIHIPVRVDGDAFASRPLIDAVFAFERRDESGDAVLVEGTDAHTVAPVGVVQRTRLRVDRVNGVALDEDPADAPVHVARLEIVPILVEDLQPVVAA